MYDNDIANQNSIILVADQWKESCNINIPSFALLTYKKKTSMLFSSAYKNL